jgi:hypothetical protein
MIPEETQACHVIDQQSGAIEPSVFDVVEGDTMREKVLRLEAVLSQYPQLPEQLTHHFSGGIYARELFIPKDAVIVGKIHRFAHLNFLMKGDISVLTEHGVKRLKAPAVIASAPGIKRAGYAHEDTVWITVHATAETDVNKIEDQVVCKSFEEFELLTVAADEVKEVA